jgi:hypothetical protein
MMGALFFNIGQVPIEKCTGSVRCAFRGDPFGQSPIVDVMADQTMKMLGEI